MVKINLNLLKKQAQKEIVQAGDLKLLKLWKRANILVDNLIHARFGRGGFTPLHAACDKQPKTTAFLVLVFSMFC